jgi:hypothetical protein
LESITKVLAPPEILEKMTTFVPRVAGPTSSPLSAKRFDVVTEFETTRLAKFDIPDTLRDMRIPVLVMFGWAAVTREPDMVFEPETGPYNVPVIPEEVIAVIFAKLVTLRVVLFINGIVRVLKKNVVLLAFEVNADGTTILDKLASPDTLRDVRIPVLVILG